MEHRERHQIWKEDRKNRKIERKIEKMERKEERKCEKKQRKMWRKLESMGECNCCCCEYYKIANGERELHLAEAEIHQVNLNVTIFKSNDESRQFLLLCNRNQTIAIRKIVSRMMKGDIFQMHISRNHPNAMHPTSPAVLTSHEVRVLLSSKGLRQIIFR